MSAFGKGWVTETPRTTSQDLGIGVEGDSVDLAEMSGQLPQTFA
jgi:hypothetical protein